MDDITVIVSQVYQTGAILPLVMETCQGRSWATIYDQSITSGAINQPGIYISAWVDSSGKMVVDCVFTVTEDPQAPYGLTHNKGLPDPAPVNITRWPPKR